MLQSEHHYSYYQALQAVYWRKFPTSSTSSTSPQISRSILKEVGGCFVQSRKATGASVMTSEKDVHVASPTQEPLSHRMSDSGVAEYADRDFLMTDIQSDHPNDIGEKTLMATIEGSQKTIPLESAPIEGEDEIITPKEGSIVVYKPIEEVLKVINSIITPEGGALETLASEMKVDVCKGSESNGSQHLMETSSL